MGQVYTKLNQLVMNDVDTAADPTKAREKLETEFNTPARAVRLPDPRSITQHIDRTPIYAALVNGGGSGDTPKTAKPSVPRARYLETDLDDVLKLDGSLQVANMTTSTPVARKVMAPAPVAEDIVDSIIEEAMEQISELKFSDTGVCEVMTSEPSNSFVYSKETPSEANRAVLLTSSTCVSGRVSYAEEAVADEIGQSFAEEVVIDPEDVEGISDVVDEHVGDSLTGNWSGIGGPDRSIGTEGELSCRIPPDCSTSDILIVLDDVCRTPSDSLIVHNHSASFQLSSSMVVQTDSASMCPDSDSAFDLPESNVDDSLVVDSPVLVYRDDDDLDINNKKNLMSTPQKSLLTAKNGPRTPLGNVSKNSPIISQLQPKPLAAPDGKLWKNVQEERLKRGLDSENTPPHPTGFSSYPPEVVQSAPGKLRGKNKKTGAKWANDSLVI